MEKTVDLHTHSTASDGSFSPEALVREAVTAGVSAIALTDHDSVGGVEQALQAGEQTGMEVIPGVELSTDYAKEEVHVVGLFIDHENQALKAQLHRFVEERDGRNVKIIAKLQKTGFDISVEAVYSRNPDSVISRPHIARYLVETGQAPDVQWVFDHYVAAGKSCYVERYKITPVEAVGVIHAADGLAVLAHPCLYHLQEEVLLRMVGEMKEAGLDGIEALYARNKSGDEERFRKIAADYGLLLSGGSDFHGASKPDIKIGTGRGALCVPYELLARMKEVRKGVHHE